MAKRLGLGAKRLPPGPSGLALIEEALASGVRLFDTADVYAPDAASIGDNERLVARALAPFRGDRDEIVVATKGGLRRQGRKWVPDGRAKHLKAACEASLRALVERCPTLELTSEPQRIPAFVIWGLEVLELTTG